MITDELNYDEESLHNELIELVQNHDEAAAERLVHALRRNKKLKNTFPCDAIKWLVKIINDIQTTDSWSIKFVYLNWLSLLVLTPFQLSRFHSDVEIQLDKIVRLSIENELLIDPTIQLIHSLYSRPDYQLKINELIYSFEVKLNHLKALNALLKCQAKRAIEKETLKKLIKNVFQIKTQSEVVIRLKVKILINAILLLNEYENELIESLLNEQIEYLKWKNTTVRWTTAKCLAKLNSQFKQNEILKFILKHSNEFDDEASMQGACLCCAQIIMMSNVPIDNENFNSMILLIKKALVFETKTISFSQGTGVRDSACFMCWSLARRKYFNQMDIQQTVELFYSLIFTALFDRELNCRRAASAAIQQLIGRTNFVIQENSIEIINLLEFNSISSLQNCYSEIAIELSSLNNDLAKMMTEFLLNHKIIHWDSQIRFLAAQTVGKIINEDQREDVIKMLFNLAQSKGNSNARHGGLLTLAQTIKDQQRFQEQINELFIWFKQNNQFKGSNGETMKNAWCFLIETFALLNYNVNDEMIDVLLGTNEVNDQPSNAIRSIIEVQMSKGTLKSSVLLDKIVNLFIEKPNVNLVKFISKSITHLSTEQVNRVALKIDSIFAQIPSGPTRPATTAPTSASNLTQEVQLQSESVILLIQLFNYHFNHLNSDQETLLKNIFLIGLNCNIKTQVKDFGVEIKQSTIKSLSTLKSSFSYLIDKNIFISIMKLCFSPIINLRSAAMKTFFQYQKGFSLEINEQNINDFLSLIHINEYTETIWLSITSIFSDVKVQLKQELVNCSDEVLLSFAQLLKRYSNVNFIETTIYLITECNKLNEKIIECAFHCALKASKHSSDVKRILKSIELFKVLYFIDGNENAFKEMVNLMGHQWPRVRIFCCEQLYLSLDDQHEEIKEILEQNDQWIYDLDQTKLKVNKIKELLFNEIK